MSNKKQTAVEWLEYQLDQYGKTHFFSKRELIAKAKAMEKEKMKEMYTEGSFAQMRYYDGLEYIKAEQYYTETYGD